MKRQDFYFDLPEELIAQDPLEDRSSSRLLVLDKETGETSHHIFKEIVDYLNPGDCLAVSYTHLLIFTVKCSTRYDLRHIDHCDVCSLSDSVDICNVRMYFSQILSLIHISMRRRESRQELHLT